MIKCDHDSAIFILNSYKTSLEYMRCASLYKLYVREHGRANGYNIKVAAPPYSSGGREDQENLGDEANTIWIILFSQGHDGWSVSRSFQ